MGVNGAGKSTLVKLLTGMYLPTSGTISVEGIPLNELDLDQWRSRTSGVFQDFVKFQFPAGQSVGVGDLGQDFAPDAVRAAVNAAGASSTVALLPNGLDTQLGRVYEGAELSHGQWQKLALARGLMRRTPLLMVLDESTAALDPQAEHDLFERFIARARAAAATDGATIVLVSHRFSTVHMADHIVVIADGTIAEAGSHEELMARDGTYAGLFTLQASAYTLDE
ncbi:ATP-binding cassette domain-containing protein [Nonomuraea sp. NPDC059023]|uniref:ATP-binding cassette domain-containing protein n=1 Tax=unclassified Nonomuraea TaxID=2593643 RepID=UPI0036A12517